VQYYAALRLPTQVTGVLVSAAQDLTGEEVPDVALDALGSLGHLLLRALRNTFSITGTFAGAQH
jgi:hypothetical protein